METEGGDLEHVIRLHSGFPKETGPDLQGNGS